MAKAITKKPAEEIIEPSNEIEQPDKTIETGESEITEDSFSQEKIVEKLPEEILIEQSISIPDIPAQMEDNSISQEQKAETEIEFLYRILNIQEEGGFGRHLNSIIIERIKSLS